MGAYESQLRAYIDVSRLVQQGHAGGGACAPLYSECTGQSDTYCCTVAWLLTYTLGCTSV